MGTLIYKVSRYRDNEGGQLRLGERIDREGNIKAFATLSFRHDLLSGIPTSYIGSDFEYDFRDKLAFFEVEYTALNYKAYCEFKEYISKPTVKVYKSEIGKDRYQVRGITHNLVLQGLDLDPYIDDIDSNQISHPFYVSFNGNLDHNLCSNVQRRLDSYFDLKQLLTNPPCDSEGKSLLTQVQLHIDVREAFFINFFSPNSNSFNYNKLNNGCLNLKILPEMVSNISLVLSTQKEFVTKDEGIKVNLANLLQVKKLTYLSKSKANQVLDNPDDIAEALNQMKKLSYAKAKSKIINDFKMDDNPNSHQEYEEKPKESKTTNTEFKKTRFEF